MSLSIFSSFFVGNLTGILTILLTIVTGFYVWTKYHYGFWKKYNVPHLKPEVIFGNFKNVFLMRKCVTQHFDEIYNDPELKDKSAVGLFVFHKPCLMLRDVDLIKNILIKDFSKFSNRFSASDPHSDQLGADNLFFVKNPRWRQLRTKLSPVFTSGRIKQMFPLVEEIGRRLDTHLCSLTGTSRTKSFASEIKDISALYSTDVIASVAYGIEANSLKNPDGDFRRNGKRIFDFTIRRGLEVNSLFFLPQIIRFFGFKVFSKMSSEFIRNTVMYVMQERMKSNTTRNDLIDILLNFKREAEADTENKHFILEGDCLVAQASIFFSAGFETSSTTMSFALYELAKHPQIQERLRNEIRDVLTENDGKLTYEVLMEMKYLGHVVQEVLRLYPAMPFLDRECTLNRNEAREGYSLEPTYNFSIPHGMPIYIPIFSIQRDDKYFPNADSFNPDRFSQEQIHKNNMAAYLPFGNGPHNCIGERFGLLQTKVGLVNFLRNHYVTPTEKTPEKFKWHPRAVLLQPLEGIHLNIVYEPLM